MDDPTSQVDDTKTRDRLNFTYNNDAEPFASMLQWGSDIRKLPTFKKSDRGGWYYDPFLSTEKKKVTIGRADDGRTAAKDMAITCIDALYAIRNWEVPSGYTPKLGRDSSQNRNQARGTAGITFKSKGFGWVSIQIGKESGYGSDAEAWFARITIPTAVATALTRQSVLLQDIGCTFNATWNTSEDLRAEDITSAFFKDPIAEFENLSTMFKRMVVLDQQHISVKTKHILKWVKGLEWEGTYDEQKFVEASRNPYEQVYDSGTSRGTDTSAVATIEYSVDKAILMMSAAYRAVAVREGAREAIDTMNEAFNHIGVKFEPTFTRQLTADGERRWEQVVEGVKIVVPKGTGNGSHNREGHTITIRHDGVAVECGYVNDEASYIDDQSRQALSDIEAMMKDMS